MIEHTKYNCRNAKPDAWGRLACKLWNYQSSDELARDALFAAQCRSCKSFRLQVGLCPVAGQHPVAPGIETCVDCSH